MLRFDDLNNQILEQVSIFLYYSNHVKISLLNFIKVYLTKVKIILNSLFKIIYLIKLLQCLTIKYLSKTYTSKFQNSLMKLV